jgi:hypothetical protein
VAQTGKYIKTTFETIALGPRRRLLLTRSTDIAINVEVLTLYPNGVEQWVTDWSVPAIVLTDEAATLVCSVLARWTK